MLSEVNILEFQFTQTYLYVDLSKYEVHNFIHILKCHHLDCGF